MLGRFRPHQMAKRRDVPERRQFGGLSVLDHVMVGFHLHLRAGIGGICSRPSGSDEELALPQGDSSSWASRRLDSQPTSLRPTALAGSLRRSPRSRLLLLDEPAAGVNRPRSSTGQDHSGHPGTLATQVVIGIAWI